MSEYQEYKDHGTLRSSTILTNSYVAATTIENVRLHNQLIIYVDFTIGSLTSGEIKVEYSPDNTNFYQEAAESVSGGTITATLAERTVGATGAYYFAIPIKAKYIKISAKGTGTVTSSLMTIKAISANV